MKSTKKTLSRIFGILFAAMIAVATGSPALAFSGLLLAWLAAPGLKYMGTGLSFADIFDPTDADMDEDDVRTLDECIYEGFFKNAALSEIMNIQEGIKTKKRIQILNNLTGLAGAVQTDCVPAANETEGTTTRKVWDLAYIDDRWSQCYKDLLGTFWQQWLKANKNKADITGTAFATYLGTVLPPYIAEILLRIVFFGDKAIAAGTNNNLSAGQVRYFSMINGIFKQTDAIVTANPSQGIAIAKNAGASYALQKFDATDVTNQVITGTFQQMWVGADSRLTDMDPSQLVILCTKTVSDQYWLERLKASGIPLAYERTETGISQLRWNGIPVIPMKIWDRIITSYFGDDATPVKSINPHRIIMTTKDNLLAGTEQQGTMESFDAFYSKDDKDFKVDWGCSIDAKVGHDHLIMVGQ